ncbi:LLM class flavin-dependent oxidoreductase [Acetobacterium sp. UBA5834]|jgi:hypothetical protein|uniref:LLM class flavin-dependent oxidoreductase n=1 Tax=Acetobacterium sp. UBA5834 TaxID=1945907 RepID=UPI00257B5010|nr:LLM class flavin-dependent oxidoreductase [Acetobacterium sp. UBA5834]
MSNEEITLIKNEVKSEITKRGFTLSDVLKVWNERLPMGEKEMTLSNLSNKLSRGTVKYAEIKLIADIIGCSIRWEPKDQ